MQEAGASFALIGGALLLGAMSPGPSFVFTVRASLARRGQGLSAALGMGTGGAVFAALALGGLITLLERVPGLYQTVRVLGGLYLLYMAFRLWRTASQPLDAPDQAPRAALGATYGLSLLTQLSNPKTALVYGSVFATLMPASTPSWFVVGLVPLVFLIEAGWYAVVALAFSSELPRKTYSRSKKWVDRAAGTTFGALGVHLIASRARLS